MPAPERFLSDEGMNVYDAAIKVIGELKAEIARQKEEIELQNIILNPGDHINEQKRGDETILVLTKGKWLIRSPRESDEEIAKKNEELTRIKSKTWCAYCGYEIERDSNAAEKISEHIMTCPDHPMRLWERHCEALEKQVKQYKDEIATLAEKYLRAGAIAECFRDDNTVLKQEIAELKSKYPPIPDDLLEDKP